MSSLLTARQVDRLLLYPRGRSARLAKAGKLTHVTLPDGELRFRAADIAELIYGPALHQASPPLRLVPSDATEGDDAR
jgi:hypothetical protein